MPFYRRLCALDPRNLQDMTASWEDVRDLFGPNLNTDDDEDLRARKSRLDELLRNEWNRYRRIESCSVLHHSDLEQFWRARGSVLYDAVELYLWYPTSAAVVERSFSLAGLIDAKNRQRGSKEFKSVAVTMYCNGDVEGRWSVQQ